MTAETTYVNQYSPSFRVDIDLQCIFGIQQVGQLWESYGDINLEFHVVAFPLTIDILQFV